MATATPARRDPLVELSRATVVLLGLACGVVIAAGLKAAGGIVGPVLLALVCVIAVHPLRVALARWMPGWLAGAICLVAVYLLLAGLAVALVIAAARFAALLRDYDDQFSDLVENVVRQLEAAGLTEEDVRRITDGFDLSELSGIVSSALHGMLGLVSNLVFIFSLVWFMAVDGGSFPRRLAGAAGDRPALVDALTRFAHDTRRYLVVATVFGLVVAALDTGALVILGIPVPLLWGLLAFLTNYIPNVGFVIGLIPPAILALLEGGIGLMLAVILIYSVLNFVIQSMIQPKIVGDSVGLSSTLSFLSLVVWSWILGPLGAVLAVPMSLLVRAVLVDADPSVRWVVPLIGGPTRTEPGAPEPSPATESE